MSCQPGGRTHCIIGICGGVCSGKSTIAEMFRGLGAKCFDADKAAHAVLREEAVKQAIRRRWGAAVFDGRGEVKRKALAAIAFADAAQLTALNRMVHPGVKKKMEEFIHENKDEIIVLDVALLLEGGWEHVCDHVVFVDTGEQTRADRGKRDRGWSREELSARQARQMPPDIKKKHSHFIVNNRGTKQESLEQVKTIWTKVQNQK